MTDISDKLSEVQKNVQSIEHVLPRGGGSKPGLSIPPDGFESLEMISLNGVIEYEPEEFTITALAGTPISEINSILSENHQYLPFDPPLAEGGATLGGTVAAGVSGPGRYRYGGLRDFLLGVKYIDYSGVIQRGGGKVVKNAAGFDLAKIMIGSLGSFGVIIESTLKVFPAPETYSTLKLRFENLDEALGNLQKASVSQLDFESIDLLSENGKWTLWVRVGSLAENVEARLGRVYEFLGKGDAFQGNDEEAAWQNFREFSWVPVGWQLIKIPFTPGKIKNFENRIIGLDTLRHYSCAGQVLWLAVNNAIEEFDKLLIDMDLSGLIIFGSPERKRIGRDVSDSFYRKVKSALDPINRFVEV
jgi:glycolate oxidase FAD binding subunit